MNTGAINDPLAAWRRTDEGSAWQLVHALRNLEAIRAMPRCGAKAKHSGAPCRQPGSGRGGRCHYHGGASTAGETWGLRQWSDNPSPVVARRQEAKARWVERAEREREERLAAMSAAERQRYDDWRRARAPGSQDQRVGAKLQLAFSGGEAQNVPDMTISELQALLDELRAEKKAWEAHCAAQPYLGVFE